MSDEKCGLCGNTGRAVVLDSIEPIASHDVPCPECAGRDLGERVVGELRGQAREMLDPEDIAEAEAMNLDTARVSYVSALRNWRGTIVQMRNALAERDAERARADRHLATLHAIYDASALGKIADELDEENWATGAKEVRAAILTIERERARAEKAESHAARAERVAHDVQAERDAWTAAAQSFVDAFDPLATPVSTASFSAVARGVKVANERLRADLGRVREALGRANAIANDDERRADRYECERNEAEDIANAALAAGLAECERLRASAPGPTLGQLLNRLASARAHVAEAMRAPAVSVGGAAGSLARERLRDAVTERETAEAALRAFEAACAAAEGK